MTDITEQSYEFYQNHSKEDCYDFAVELLYRLERDGFCIWQTYTQDDIRFNTGKQPTPQKMAELQERLQNTFANDYLTD